MEAAVVSVSQGAMGSLLGKLGDLLADKYKLPKEAKGEIMFLKAELESMQDILHMPLHICITNGTSTYGTTLRHLRRTTFGTSTYGSTFIPLRIKTFGTFTYAPRLCEFKHLRDLRLEFPSRNRELEILDLTGMCHLFQLRYLKVVAHGKIALPSKIRGLQQLETLDLRGCSMVEVPSDDVHLRRLLPLIVPIGKRMEVPSVHLPGLEYLKSLQCFDWDIDIERDLADLTKLRRLDICCSPGKKQLDDMAARRRDDSACSDELSSLSASLPLLQRLHLCCTFSRVPKWIGELHNLPNLTLWVKEVREDDAGILAQLPSLIHLDLHIQGTPREKLVISGMGFPVLKHFSIGCSRISYLTFEAGAMPKLQRLHLYFNARGWHKYGAAPAGIENLSGLKEISVDIGGPGAKESNRKAAQSALRDAIDVHPGHPTANIECPPNTTVLFERVENEEEDENVNSSS